MEKPSKLGQNLGQKVHWNFGSFRSGRGPNSQRSLRRLRIEPWQLHLLHHEPIGVGPRGARLRRRNARNIARFRPKRRWNDAEVATVLQGAAVQIQGLSAAEGDPAKAAVETDSKRKPAKPGLRDGSQSPSSSRWLQ